MKTAAKLSKRILEVLPPVLARLREEFRASSGAPVELSVPQLRVLSCVQRGMELVGDIARHQGVSQPAMSKMVEGLVDRGYVERHASRTDRRRVPLRLTRKGAALHASTLRKTELKIEMERLPLLDEDEQEKLLSALDLLEKVFKKNGVKRS